MTLGTGRSILIRALLRSGAVALLLAVLIEILRHNDASSVSRDQQLVIAIAGGAVYGAFWSLSAMLLARVLSAADRKLKEHDQ